MSGIGAKSIQSYTLARCLARFIVCGPLIVSGACSLPRSTQSPPLSLEIPERWSVERQGNNTIDQSAYWAQFNDPLLDQFIARALDRNRDLAVAGLRIAQAEQSLIASRSSLFPSANADLGASRNIGAQTSSAVRYSAGVSSNWEVDLFGRISLDIARSSADIRSAQYSAGDVQRLLVGRVAQFFVSARAIAAQLAIARDTLSIQHQNLQIAQWRAKAGLVSSFDVEQAKAQVAQTAASVPLLESQLGAVANSISTLIGEPPGAVREALAADVGVPEPPTNVAIELPATALRHRPDVGRAEANLVASAATLGIRRADLLPFLQFSASAGSGSIEIGNLFDLVTGTLLLSLQQLIFDGGRARAGISIAEKEVQIALATWEQTILVALEEVETASIAQVAAEERLIVLNEALLATIEATDIARAQYRVGLIDFQTLQLSEAQLLGARNLVVSAKAERASTFIALTQAMGGGWDTTIVSLASNGGADG